jgi:hypothetical protein
MEVDPQQLLKDGFVVLRQVVPSDQLEMLRGVFEKLVDRQRAVWAKERKPDDPPGGVWETGAQPRVSQFQRLIDAETAAAVEFCLHENTLGVSRRLMQAPAAIPNGLMLMCSPVRDHGPAAWHRDIHPIDQAPLEGLELDTLANGPGYLQWNIPLYDDDVLWVVPGSNRRVNTPKENQQLLEDPRQPLPHSIPVELKAGDGVVYSNLILHWGSNYSAQLRRTIHLGYRSLKNRLFPYVPGVVREREYWQYLKSESKALIERLLGMYEKECNLLTATYRAVLDGDGDQFKRYLAQVHPGEEGRLVAVILLSKLAHKMSKGNHEYRSGYGGDWTQEHEVAPRFSEQELERLWRRFEGLDKRLQSDTQQYVPGFQSGPMPYHLNEMPVDFGVADFISSWGE